MERTIIISKDMRSYFYFGYVCCIIIIIATLASITSSFDWISSSFPSSSCNHRTPIAFTWIAGLYGSTEILTSSPLSNGDHRPLRSKEDPCHGGGSFYHSLSEFYGAGETYQNSHGDMNPLQS